MLNSRVVVNMRDFIYLFQNAKKHEGKKKEREREEVAGDRFAGPTVSAEDRENQGGEIG